MSRPLVRLTTENTAPMLRIHLASTLPDFTDLPGVEGVTLNGGLSRGYADDLSEIDVRVYLSDAGLAAWQQGALAIPNGIVMLHGQLYDVSVCALAAEHQEEWSEVAKWDASYSEILFDPHGAIARLYGAKLAEPPSTAETGHHLFTAWWHIWLAGAIWIHRQDGLQAHLLLNRALEPLVHALFAANGEYVPHEKWLVHFSRTLNWVPPSWPERLAQAMTVPEPSIVAAAARRQVMANLWDDIDRHVVATQFPGFPLRAMQKRSYDLLKLLAERERMRLAEWSAQAAPAMLQGDPFRACVTVAGDQVHLDRARLKAVQPSDMYSWFYEIAAAVAAEVR